MTAPPTLPVAQVRQARALLRWSSPRLRPSDTPALIEFERRELPGIIPTAQAIQAVNPAHPRRLGLYLPSRIGEGCENAMALWRELRQRRYLGTSRQVHRFVAERRSKPTRSGRKPRVETMPAPGREAVEPSLPSARQPACLLVQATSTLDASAVAVVARLEQDATARAVADPARRFTEFVRASGVGKTAAPGRDAAVEFDAWITTAKACSAPAIATSASGLDGDAAAVRSALTQRTGRRPDQLAEAHQAPELRASGPRPARAPLGPGHMIHAK